MADGPRYSDDEVALILRRAAELQHQEARTGESGTMSLAEIQAAADEAGLNRALVRRAAAEMARPALEGRELNRWLGGPTQVVIERELVGEYPQDEFDHLLEIIRFGPTGPGQISTVGRSLTWTGTLGGSQTAVVTVAVSVRQGHTRIRVHASLTPLAGAIFGGVGGGVGGGLAWLPFFGGAMLGGPLLSIGLGTSFLAGVYALCRRIYAGRSAHHANKLKGLADELERVIEGRLALNA